jgi:hypothetical protein
VGLLNNLEQRLDKIVNGSFSKAFKSDVEPVELAAGLQQELDMRAIASDGGNLVPNIFVIELGSADHSRLAPYFGNMSNELATVVNTYATDQRYSLPGWPSITFAQDEALETGVFRIRSTSGRAPTVAPQVNPDLTAQVPPVVMQSSATPKLVAINGYEYPLTQSVTTLGRGDTVDIKIDDAGVSRTHCSIVLGSTVILHDNGSTNGTVVDGVRATEAELHEGSIIKLGATTLTYKSR